VQEQINHQSTNKSSAPNSIQSQIWSQIWSCNLKMVQPKFQFGVLHTRTLDLLCQWLIKC